ncbi:MAG TPA: hypothetical protein VJ852_07005 [Gemmatimonadaceae bacterium]|nr:hypothetical protein [Gemmatimonadaceae bacterium]
MSATSVGTPGKARLCPHCKATILQSATICPACDHSLRFDSQRKRRAAPSFSPLRVEGTITHPDAGEAWEYSVVITILDEQQREITRQVVSVGVLNPDEQRTFRLGVDVFTPSSEEASKEKVGAAN